MPRACYRAATAVLPPIGNAAVRARGAGVAATEGDARELDDDAAQAAAVVLADGTVTLGAGRLKAVRLLGFCLLVTAVFVAGVLAGSTVGAGVGVVVVVGALSVVCALRLLRSRVHLRFGPDGLKVRSSFWTRRWAWNDVENFRAYEIQAVQLDQARRVRPAPPDARAAVVLKEREPGRQRGRRRAPRQLRPRPS